MFLRKKPNKTGTVSVQVIDKSTGKYKVIKSFGVGRTKYEVSVLEVKARQFIQFELHPEN